MGSHVQIPPVVLQVKFKVHDIQGGSHFRPAWLSILISIDPCLCIFTLCLPAHHLLLNYQDFGSDFPFLSLLKFDPVFRTGFFVGLFSWKLLRIPTSIKNYFLFPSPDPYHLAHAYLVQSIFYSLICDNYLWTCLQGFSCRNQEHRDCVLVITVSPGLSIILRMSDT